MTVNAKQIRNAENEVTELEMSMLWHLRAKHHRGFTNYHELMTHEELTATRDRHRALKNFLYDNRKNHSVNAK